MIETLVIFALLSSALWYLGSRALITRRLWSMYSPRFARFMDCSACSGFWYGYLMTLVASFQDALLNPLQPSRILDSVPTWAAPIIVGLSMIVLVPIVAGFMQRGLDTLGTIEINTDESDEED